MPRRRDVPRCGGPWLVYAIYVTATLGVPLARGAARTPGFGEHAAFVLLVPALMVLLGCGLAGWRRRRSR